MLVKSFFKLTKNQKIKFYQDLKDASESDDPAAENMWADDWETKNNTLPFLLEKRARFVPPNGDFHVVYDGKKFVACGGIYKSDFSEYVALAGTRTWVNREYRNQLIPREVLLPVHKQWAIDNKCKQVALCFNEYNKGLMKVWARRRAGESRGPRQSHHLFYNDLNIVEFPVTIQYTKQWVMYERLQADWEFSWDSIKHDAI